MAGQWREWRSRRHHDGRPRPPAGKVAILLFIVVVAGLVNGRSRVRTFAGETRSQGLPRVPIRPAARAHRTRLAAGYKMKEMDGDAMQEQWSKFSKRPFRRMLALQKGVARVGFHVLRSRFARNKTRASELRRAAGQRAVEELLFLGPTYVKLGQIASCRGDIIAEEYVDELKVLQDSVPAFSGKRAAAMMEAELGKPVDQLLRSFNETAMAAASLGQVHRGVLHDGSEVAIKIQRSDLKQMYDLDLAQFDKVVKMLDRFGIGVKGSTSSWQEIFDAAKVILYREIDYLAEANNTERCGKIFDEYEKAKWIKIPRVITNLTSPKVLTMEYVPGVKISKVDELEQRGFDRKKLAKRLSEAYLLSFCKYGFFNTDPHPGNLAVDDGVPGGRLILYDFGQACELEESQCKGILQTIQAIMDYDAKACVEAFVNLGCLKENADLEAVEKEVSNNFATGKIKSKAATGGKPEEDTSAKKGAGAKYFQMPASLAFVTRAITQMQGVGVLLDEDWEFIESVADKVPELQMEQGAGLLYLADQFFKNLWSRSTKRV